MKPLLLIILIAYAFLVTAQVSDSFSDGDFSDNPSWFGDDSLFMVNASFQLQNRGTTAKDISLSTVSERVSGEWHFWCRFNLSPSTSNFMRLYVMSDAANLKGPLNGYYVQLGGVTGNADSITLYKQKGTTRKRIIAGRMGTVAKTNNTVGVKVLRDTLGNWQLFSDTTGGNEYIYEGSGSDKEWMTSGFAGVFIRFTNSTAGSYFLDEMYAGPVKMDTVPPVPDSVQVISPSQLRLVFNENINEISGLDTLNYDIDKGVGHPVSVQYELGKKNIVLLTFAQPMMDTEYELTVNSVADVAGNILANRKISFTYHDVFTVKLYDVLISEFLPDPTPVAGLPEQEYVELYNNAGHDLRLSGFIISDGTSNATIPDLELKADRFLILCAPEHVPFFAPFGNVAGVKGMPSLNNTGDHILLKDKTGKVIHELEYDLSWYHDDSKSGGGNSIELISPRQLCKEKQNFRVSADGSGGTPGARNSNWDMLPDTTAPHVKAISVTGEKNLLLVFDERMDRLSLLNGLFSFVPFNAIEPAGIISVSCDSLFVELSHALVKNSVFTVSYSGMKDCSGNMLTQSSVELRYIVADTARQYDVLINEVFPDPDPAIGLPAAEYIELYNRSDRIVSLHNWTLSDGNTSALLSDRILMPDSFLVITSGNNLPKFAGMGQIMGVHTFPSLGNDGDALVLRNELGNTIHYLVYTSGAYRDNLKKKGGWSLELVDVNNPCGGDGNLLASRDPDGGTPGRRNSVQGVRPDHVPPQLISAYPLSNQTLELRFNESMDSASLIGLASYKVNPELESPVAVAFYPPAYDKVALTFADSIREQSVYSIIVNDLRDCAGNSISAENYTDWGLPEQTDSNDLVINEILFDPRGMGSDFVELVNRSEHIVDLKDLYIANTNTDHSIGDFYPIDTNGLLLLPGSYLVLTENPSDIRSEYTVQQPRQLVKCKLPAFNNDEGNCVITDRMGMRYDELHYTAKMHFALLNDPDGVSLERIDFNRPASDPTNWTSAASTSGYATPTSRNSQYASVEQKGTITAEPEVFSPDGDGYHDVVCFRYTLDKPGFTGNFCLYNSSGQLVKRLWRNELLGTSGVCSWDGISDDHIKAPIGIYLCCVELFNLEGEVRHYRMTVVVGAKL